MVGILRAVVSHPKSRPPRHNCFHRIARRRVGAVDVAARIVQNGRVAVQARGTGLNMPPKGIH